MNTHIVHGALISSDASFRESVKQVLGGAEHGVELSVEITIACTEINEAQVEELRRVALDLVLLDFERDPTTGIKFAHFLADLDPHRQLVATGPPLSPDLLLEAMRAGTWEYLPKPVPAEALRTALHRVMRKLGWVPSGGLQPAGRLYALFSPKGGCGCTTAATNLAIVLHRLTGKKTLLVDLDLELGDTVLLLGVEPRFSLIDVVRNFHRMDAGLLGSFVERHESGVHLLSAPDHVDRAEVPAEDQIRTILHFVKQHYAYVVVDTSTSLTPSALAAFGEADRILVVTNLDLPSLRNLQRRLPLLERTAGKAVRDRIRIVVNRYAGNDVISLGDVQRTLGMKVSWTLSNDYAAVSRSINAGKPVVLNGKSRYTRDLQPLGADLAGLRPGSRAGEGPHLGWRGLSLLWRRPPRHPGEEGARGPATPPQRGGRRPGARAAPPHAAP